MLFNNQVEEKVTMAEGAIVEVAEEDAEANPPVSEQMEVYMSQIHEKIDNFTQQVIILEINCI